MEVFKRLKAAGVERKTKHKKATEETLANGEGKITVTIKQGRTGMLEMRWQTKNISRRTEFELIAKKIAVKYF